jgi:hypothetical protein
VLITVDGGPSFSGTCAGTRYEFPDRKRYTVDPVVGNLREAVVETAQGLTVGGGAPQVGCAKERTSYRSHSE